MKEHKPVALWKGIAGTAISGTVLLILAPIDYILLTKVKDIELWLMVTLAVCTIVCVFSLFVSLYNLITTSSYIKEHKEEAKKQAPQPKKNNDNTELLHRLLTEGKITIEEYDQLKGK